MLKNEIKDSLVPCNANPAFMERKLRNRLFLVRHIETGRYFEVIGAPTIHKWECKEVKLGPKEVIMSRRNVPIVDWKSKKSLLLRIEAWVAELDVEKAMRPEPYKEPFAPMPHYTLKPVKKTPLRMAQLAPHRFRYRTIDARRTFFIEYKNAKEGWKCREQGVEQFIAQGMRSQEDALMELYGWLDEQDPTFEKLNVTLHMEIYEMVPWSQHRMVRVVYRGERLAVMTAFVEKEENLEYSLGLERKLWIQQGYDLVEERMNGFEPKTEATA